MTREERCWADLCKRLQRDPATSEESDTCTLRVAFKYALAFADAEAAAMRERAAGIADSHVAMGYMSGRERDYCHQHGDEIAELIRALPATGEVGRG